MFLFLPGRSNTRKWPRCSQCSAELRAAQLRPRGHGSAPERGGSGRGLGRDLGCSLLLHKVVPLSLLSITARGSSDSWEMLSSLCQGAGCWGVELMPWSWLWRAGMGWGHPDSLSGDLEPLLTKNPRKPVLGFVYSLMVIFTTSLLFCRFPWSKSWINKFFHADLD